MGVAHGGGLARASDGIGVPASGPRTPPASRRAERAPHRALRERQQRLRIGAGAYILGGDARTFLSAPVIYSLLVPFALLDVWVTVYQWTCFPAYGIARVPRRRYFALDRHTLAYLNIIEKINCTFCTYANGVLAYVREVAARTEQYWCPIKHSRRIPEPHRRYADFAEFGDAEAFRAGQPALRARLAPRGRRDAPPSGR